MTTNTTKYQFSHGKKPSGYGCWIFNITGTDNQGRYTTATIMASGKLTEAKRVACAEFKQTVGGIKKITEIEVLP